MTLDIGKLPDFLRAQRWFAGKAVPIKKVAVVDHAPIPGVSGVGGRGPPVVAVLEVQYQLGQPERYLLPVFPGPEGEPIDAIADENVARALLDLIRKGAKVESGAAALVGELIPGAEALLDQVGPAAKVRQLDAEQTNSSLVFGEKVILKLIRKLEAGVSPEHEMGRFLMTRTRFRDTPALLGALHLEGQSAATVGVVHRFVRDARDGWAWMLAELRERGELDAWLRSRLQELGRTVGEFHLAMASAPDDPAFAPEPILREDLQRWSSSIIGELGVTLSLIGERYPAVQERRGELRERAHRIAHLEPGGKKIRIHGDLHLGQVLREDERWLLFDFEGEPGRPFQQRREKTTPLKDVAGLLRSFGYASATLAKEGKPIPGLEPLARKAILDGYLEVARGSGLLPERDPDLTGLLDGMELEKVLYEVRYEYNHRPDWVEIPVGALRAEGRP